MLLHDFVFILFSTLYAPFCILFQIFFRHIDKKKKKEYFILCNMLFPLKTEESASQLKGCDAKLQGPVIWQPAARYSLRVR